jgi:hypothetical protein
VFLELIDWVGVRTEHAEFGGSRASTKA